jgi:hypothetical protein
MQKSGQLEHFIDVKVIYTFPDNDTVVYEAIQRNWKKWNPDWEV